MEWSGEGIICSVLRHGDAGAIVRLLTADAGLIAGYVRGGQSRKMAPVLMAGNQVAANWRARVDDQLGGLTAELTRSVAATLLTDRLASAGVGWITALAATVMPERQPYPRAHAAIAGLIDRAGQGDCRWAGELAATELVILSELGFGLDLTSCAATGVTNDLAYVSPRSAQAVSRDGAAGWEARLFSLPAFLRDEVDASDWDQVRAALNLTGHFIERHLLEGRAGRILTARTQLMAALR